MNKTVVISGAAGVLCGVIANDYAKAGYNVALLDINKDALTLAEKNLTEKGYSVKGYVANVLDKDSLVSAYNAVIADFKQVDILINGAGGNSPKATTFNEIDKEKVSDKPDFFALDKAGVDFVFNLNFMGTFLTTQVFAKDMALRKDGIIINISSMNAFTPLTKIPAYSAAKASVSNFTNGLQRTLPKAESE